MPKYRSLSSFTGLDFSQGNDLHTASYLAARRHPSGRGTEFFADCDAWIKEETLERSAIRPLYETWIEQGWLHVSEGKVFQPSMFIARTKELLGKGCQFMYWGYDKYQSKDPINSLLAFLQSDMNVQKPEMYVQVVSQLNSEFNAPTDDLYAAAIDACRQLIGSGVFSLHTGNPMSAYSDLFLSEDIPSEEVIWSRQANEAMNIMHQTTLEYNSPTAAQKYSPTKELVSMYLNLDGTPVATDKVSVADEFTGRDYRLAQTVMGPGHTWLLNNGTVEAKAPNWTYVLTGYEFCKWNIEKQYCYTASRCNNSMPIIRYAEILLIYAEAMEETGQMDESVWESTVGAIRRRSGVTSIYPGSAAYKADPILTAYYNGDGIGKDVSNTMLEIRRERVTELCMEWNNRHDDLYRWAEGPIIARRYQGRGWRGIWVTQAEANNGISFNYFDYTVGQASNTARN